MGERHGWLFVPTFTRTTTTSWPTIWPSGWPSGTAPARPSSTSVRANQRAGPPRTATSWLSNWAATRPKAGLGRTGWCRSSSTCRTPRPAWVKSRRGAVAGGSESRGWPAAFAHLPMPHSDPWLGLHVPLIEPDVRISRIRLSIAPGSVDQAQARSDEGQDTADHAVWLRPLWGTPCRSHGPSWTCH